MDIKLQRKAMKRIMLSISLLKGVNFYPLLFLIMIIGKSCGGDKTTTYKISEKSYDFQKIKDINKVHSMLNHFSAEYIDKELHLFFFSDSTSLYDFNIYENVLNVKHLRNFHVEANDVIGYEQNNLFLMRHNDLLKYNLITDSITMIKENIFDKGEFAIYHLYAPSLKVIEKDLYVNYGKRNDILIDEFSVKRISNSGIEKILPYPKQYADKYIHYNEVNFVKNNNTYYYTIAGLGYLGRYFNNKSDFKALKNSEQYKLYDTSKMTDMVYLKNYTEETLHNHRLFYIEGKIINMIKFHKDEKWKFRLDLYNSETLDFIESIDLPDDIEFNSKMIGSSSNAIYLVNPVKNKVYEISF